MHPAAPSHEAMSVSQARVQACHSTGTAKVNSRVWPHDHPKRTTSHGQGQRATTVSEFTPSLAFTDAHYLLLASGGTE